MLEVKDISWKKLPFDVIVGFLFFLLCYRLVRRFGALDFVSPRFRMIWLGFSFLMPVLGAYLLWRNPNWARRSIFAAGPSLLLGLTCYPWLAICFASMFKWSKKIGYVMLGFLFATSLLAFVLDWGAISHRLIKDEEYERQLIGTLQLQNAKLLPLKAYRELLPATQEPFVEVLQERPLLDGLRLRRMLANDSEADDVQMREIGDKDNEDNEDNEVECTFLLNGTGTGSTESFKVR
ncbi:MAG: hypothetical protein K2X81_10500 [Candidatus Obscuribacterales bacterium]|nr:hypothetical protein [Candidatus Obscuribacterales bacterium]